MYKTTTIRLVEAKFTVNEYSLGNSEYVSTCIRIRVVCNVLCFQTNVIYFSLVAPLDDKLNFAISV